jgi:hypothetical protein
MDIDQAREGFMMQLPTMDAGFALASKVKIHPVFVFGAGLLLSIFVSF